MTPASVRLLCRVILEDDFRPVRALIRREMALGPSVRTLELGCGAGLFADMFARGDYVGVDADPREIERARRTRPGTFVVGDARPGLELPDARFDQVLIHGLIHRLPDPEARAVLGEAMRVLDPEGAALVVEPVFASRGDGAGGWLARLVGARRDLEACRRLCRTSALVRRDELMHSGLLPVYVVTLARPGRSSTG